jgi:hypothetical protein
VAKRHDKAKAAAAEAMTAFERAADKLEAAEAQHS